MAKGLEFFLGTPVRAKRGKKKMVSSNGQWLSRLRFIVRAGTFTAFLEAPPRGPELVTTDGSAQAHVSLPGQDLYIQSRHILQRIRSSGSRKPMQTEAVTALKCYRLLSDGFFNIYVNSWSSL